MPLMHSGSDEARSANIAELIRSGRPKDQAAAIAYDVQRKAGHGKKKETKHKEGPMSKALRGDDS